jgi:DNA polymerase I
MVGIGKIANEVRGMQMHDGLVLEAPSTELEIVKANVQGLMTTLVKLNVPLVAELGVGVNWEVAH